MTKSTGIRNLLNFIFEIYLPFNRFMKEKQVTICLGFYFDTLLLSLTP